MGEGLGVRVDKLILVTGATGYIASRLIPRLLENGYRVRALARNPLRLKGRAWFNKIEILQADVTSPETLVHALDSVHIAYYLIHNMSYGHGYTKLELDSARIFVTIAEDAGVEHIIYLGGLADPNSTSHRTCVRASKQGKYCARARFPSRNFARGLLRVREASPSK